MTQDSGKAVSDATLIWGIRFAVMAILMANLAGYIVSKGTYSEKSILHFSIVGTLYLVVLGTALYPRLKDSPGDGMLIGIATTLIGSATNLSTHVDAAEIYGAILALIVGPILFLVYLVRTLNLPRPSGD